MNFRVFAGHPHPHFQIGVSSLDLHPQQTRSRVEDLAYPEAVTKKTRIKSHHGKRVQQKLHAEQPKVEADLTKTQMDQTNAHVEFLSRADCVSKLSDILDELAEHHTRVQRQYDQFLTAFQEFLIALKLT